MDPILSGGTIAVFAFLLASARDEYKARRDRARRDTAVLSAIREEIGANRRLLENNQNLVRSELAMLNTAEEKLLNPLDPLESGFWDLVKLNLPKALERDDGALRSVREVARLTGQVNQMIQSRETFKNTNRVTGTFAPGERGGMKWTEEALRGYDKLLERFQDELLKAINSLAPALEQAPSGSRLARVKSLLPYS